MVDIGFAVEVLTESVATEIADDGESLRFDIGLDGVAEIAEARSGSNGLDTAIHGFIGGIDESFSLVGDRPDGVHTAAIAVPSIDDEGNVDIDDIALDEFAIAGDAVTDDVINGGADSLWKAAIIEGSGERLVIAGEGEGEVIELSGGNSGMDVFDKHIEGFGGETASASHRGEGVGVVEGDLARLGMVAGCGREHR